MTDLFRPAPRRPRWAATIALEGMEDRLVPAGRPLPSPVIYAGASAGMSPIVQAYNAETGTLDYQRTVYDESFTGGGTCRFGRPHRGWVPRSRRGPGAVGGPNIRVLDGKMGDQIAGPLGSFWAFESDFTGGVQVTAADVNGDGVPDVIAAAGAGGGPRVKVFDGATGAVVSDFFAFDPNFRGGVSVAAVDVHRTGKAELVIGAGPGGGPEVETFNPLTGAALSSFFAFDPSTRSGVTVGADAYSGDVDADGTPDIAVGTGAGVPAEVKVFSGAGGTVLRDVTPFEAGFTGGVTVGLTYADDDPHADLVVGSGPGRATAIRVFGGATGDQLPAPTGEYAPFGVVSGGVNVTAGIDPDNTLIMWTSPSAGGSSMVGQTVEFSVAFGESAPPPPAAPTGTATFTATDTVTSHTYTIGTASAVAASSFMSTATLDSSSLPVGSYTLEADYTGDANFTAATTTEPYTITPIPTTTSLTSSVNPSVWSQSVTFTATAAAGTGYTGTPTGTVTFEDGTTALGTGTLNGSGVATFTTTDLEVGTHPITATFSGDSTYATSTSSTLSQVVNKVPTTTTQFPDPGLAIVQGEMLDDDTTVQPNSPYTGTPTGTVTFTASTTILGFLVTFPIGSAELGPDPGSAPTNAFCR